MEARGRPAFLSGESPASVITSSPILSNSGRAPLVLPASTSFRARRPSSLPTASRSSVPLPPSLSPLSFELVVPRLESFFPLPFRATVSSSNRSNRVFSLMHFSRVFKNIFVNARKGKKERNLESLNARIDTERVHNSCTRHNSMFTIDLTNCGLG